MIKWHIFSVTNVTQLLLTQLIPHQNSTKFDTLKYYFLRNIIAPFNIAALRKVEMENSDDCDLWSLLYYPDSTFQFWVEKQSTIACMCHVTERRVTWPLGVSAHWARNQRTILFTKKQRNFSNRFFLFSSNRLQKEQEFLFSNDCSALPCLTKIRALKAAPPFDRKECLTLLLKVKHK